MRKLCDVDEVRKCLDEVTGDDSIYAKGLLEWAIKKRTIDEADIRADERRKFAEWLQTNGYFVYVMSTPDGLFTDEVTVDYILAEYEKEQMKGEKS